MYGLVPFFKKAKEAKIKPILGSCITDIANESIYAVLLAKNLNGYSELCRIITMRKLNEDFSLTKIINEFNENLFAITPSIELLKNIKNHKNLFAELISTKKHKRKTRELYNYAVEKKIKYVASNPVYFLEKDDYKLHKLVRA